MFSETEEDRDWRLYAGDMIEFAEKVLAYTSEIDQAAFVADSLTYDATLRNMELIGEAATHIPNEIRNKYPEIQWRSIIATRNRLAHGYLGLDDDVIWDIIQTDITELLPALRNLLSDVENANQDGQRDSR